MGFENELPNQGKTNVWLTPKYIIDALGPFDLDPCSAPEPRPWKCAETNYTEKQNGLTLPWAGFVWCNPPYGKETSIWMKRLREYGNGIALVFARTETKWFQENVIHASVVFFPKGRIDFYKPDGQPSNNSSASPSVLIGFGALSEQRLRESKLEGVFFKPA